MREIIRIPKNMGRALGLALLLNVHPASSQDSLLNILGREIEREIEVLRKQEVPPYFISYRVDDMRITQLEASFGDLMSSDSDRRRILTVQVRVGSPALDNTHEIRYGYEMLDLGLPSGRWAPIPLDDEPQALAQALWQRTDEEYREAVENFAKVRANVAVKVEAEDRSPDFSPTKIDTFYQPPLEVPGMDLGVWEERLRRISRLFLEDPDISRSLVRLRLSRVRKYFVSTEGARIVHNRLAVNLDIMGEVKAEDGMVLPLYKSYFAFSPQELPSQEELMAEAKELVKKLSAIKKAPIVEAYAGPALLTASSAGVFFHEIFGHRVEGERQKSEYDAQTFKKKMGQPVLPKELSVIFDPTIDYYRGQALNGSYLYDDQGVRAQRVEVVKRGILNDFLMSRTPIDNFPKSNGHGRAQAGMQPVARQSNLIVETANPLPMAELRRRLILELRRQGKEYGYLFAGVTGGFTMTDRFMPNAFNVTPTEVYRIYTDGRPDELVRGVDLVGTPLSVFSQIMAAGDKPEVFNGTCGAESGGVPVSAICPALFVKQIEIQRRGKSQEKPPLLPRPSLDPAPARAGSGGCQYRGEVER